MPPPSDRAPLLGGRSLPAHLQWSHARRCSYLRPPPLTSTLSAAGVARDVELGVAVREWGVYVALLSRSCACCRSLCRVSVCVVCMSVRVRVRARVWRVIRVRVCWCRAGTHAGEHIHMRP